MSLNVKLVVVGGDVKTTEIKLKLPSTIGRGRGTAIILPHPLVSRQHCELFEVDGQLMVRDLGSLNGTFVNNERVTESPIAPDELLTVGTVTFRAVYEVEEGSPAKPGPKLKPGKEEKTVQVTKGTTLAAKSKRKEPEPANSDSGVLEFDFGQPLMPKDDDADNAMQVTERMETKAAGKKPSKAGGSKIAKQANKPAAAKPAPGKSPPAKKPADAKGDSAKWAEDDADDNKAQSSSDDDLNDFLESLEDK
jgi:pSer/pThr/pTyr-binding forkhead associated (FHA) protein